MLQAGIIAMAAHWDDEELQGLQADFPDMLGVYDSNASKYNPRPGVWSYTSQKSANSAARRLTGRHLWTTGAALYPCTIYFLYVLLCRYRQNRVPACCSQQLPFLFGRRKVYTYHAIGRRAAVW